MWEGRLHCIFHKVLDQHLRDFESLMKEYPDLLLEIAAHTYHSDTFEANLKTSRKWAQEIVDLMALDKGSILNSRIEVLILN